jgi:CheY-like chemotaxis protein
MMVDGENPNAPRSLRILVVEDEVLIGVLMEDMLLDLGHEIVGPVARLDKALEAARTERMDVVLLDVNLNGETTYAVADALTARNVPFIFVTGLSGANLPAPYSKAPILQKPFQMNDLQMVLDRASKTAA